MRMIIPIYSTMLYAVFVIMLYCDIMYILVNIDQDAMKL